MFGPFALVNVSDAPSDDAGVYAQMEYSAARSSALLPLLLLVIINYCHCNYLADRS